MGVELLELDLGFHHMSGQQVLQRKLRFLDISPIKALQYRCEVDRKEVQFMQWCDFYDAFWDWSDSTRRARISSLEDIGSGDEIVEAVLEIEDPKVKAQLIRKAMKLGARFSREDLLNLDTELPDDLFEQLGNYAKVNPDDLCFDEDNMTWEDFESNYCDWSKELTARRIAKLKEFGDPESVCEVILGMPAPELEDALYNKAVVKGVKFTQDQLNRMGHIENQLNKALNNFANAEQVAQLEKDVDMLCKQLDKQFPNGHKRKSAGGCLQNMIEYSIFSIIFMLVVIVCIMLLIASSIG